MGISVPWRILEDEPSMSPRDEQKLKGAEVTVHLLIHYIYLGCL